jgi:tetratricopeptide (TPR) repeat protein
MLRSFIEQRPADPFPKYALALEHRNAGAFEEAWAAFQVLLERHPDYAPGYLHAGNTLVSLGRRDEARAVYERGIEVCRRVGDAHAGGELEGALAALG